MSLNTNFQPSICKPIETLVCSLHQEDCSVEHAASHIPTVPACLSCLPLCCFPKQQHSVLILIDLDSASFCILYSAVFLPVIILHSAVFLPVIILHSAVFLPVIILHSAVFLPVIILHSAVFLPVIILHSAVFLLSYTLQCFCLLLSYVLQCICLFLSYTLQCFCLLLAYILQYLFTQDAVYRVLRFPLFFSVFTTTQWERPTNYLATASFHIHTSSL